jgi:hypothetical protein
MMYVAAFFLVYISMGVVFTLVRAIADLIIILIGVGAFVSVCIAIHGKEISSRGDLLLSAISVGAIAAFLCILVLPFSSWYENQGKKIVVRSSQTIDD